jgi:hypothetical protein
MLLISGSVSSLPPMIRLWPLAPQYEAKRIASRQAATAERLRVAGDS